MIFLYRLVLKFFKNVFNYFLILRFGSWVVAGCRKVKRRRGQTDGDRETGDVRRRRGRTDRQRPTRGGESLRIGSSRQVVASRGIRH